MTKAKILLALISILTIFTLVSCEGLFGNQSTGEPTPEKKGYAQIVIESDDVDLMGIRNDIYDITGMIPIASPDKAAAERELVFGNTDRASTLAAKTELDKLLNANGKSAGYIIYFDGNSVAVYWSTSELQNLAISMFSKICLAQKKLVLDTGVVTSGIFTAAELAQDAKWLEIETSTTPEIYSALRLWASNFDGSYIAAWLANLWDPEIGGFYYSNSARDNEPFLPDLESTYQALGIIEGSGAISDINEQLPHEMRAKIVAFVKSTQSATEGYFLHKQWGQSIKLLSTDRYGRDLSWAVSLLKDIKLDTDGDGVLETQYPNYCTPSGYKCEEHTKNGGICSIVGLTASYSGADGALTSGMASSVSSAVSKIPSSTVRAVVSSTPDYSSSEAFTAWLTEYNSTIKENSGKAHNLNALQDEIIAKGFCDELVAFVQKAQEEVYEEQTSRGETPSGLWQYEANYSAVWGIHKYAPFFSNQGVSLKYHKEIVETCIKVVLSDANGGYAVNDLMNQWTAITAVIGDAKKHNPDVVDELYAMINENAVAMVNQTILKLDGFKLNDGMYGYTYGGYSMTKIYSVSISLGVREADVNGQLLLRSCYYAVFSAFGATSVPLCTSDDGENFVDIINSCEPIVKNPTDTVETLDFEKDSHFNKVSITKNEKDSVLEIAGDPKGENSDALHFLSVPTTQSRSDTLGIASISGGVGDCNIAEFDLYIAEAPNAALLQIYIGNSFLVQLEKSNGYIVIIVLSDESGEAWRQTILPASERIRADEWHRFRFEAYDDDGDGNPVLKFFVDDDLMATSTIYKNQRTGSTYNTTFQSLNIYSMKSVTTDIYLDNIYLHRETKDYVEGSDDISDMRG